MAEGRKSTYQSRAEIVGDWLIQHLQDEGEFIEFIQLRLKCIGGTYQDPPFHTLPKVVPFKS
jgi:hypothetical protein